MKRHLIYLLALWLLAAPLGLLGQPALPAIDIPFQKYVLPNGLTLIVHEDHKAPIVAVNVWYHVGSKNEKPGKSGFAHLFEHLMFNGSENYNTDYFQALEKIGATDLNGTTNNDRTNYFQNVPISALDQVLFLESDRMGHLLGAIDQAKLDEQRGVVQNEKRQGENQPYGKSWDLITKATFPKGHPYSWTVIGEMEDLNAASLDDVKEWFRTYYGAANATVVIAGDIKPEDAYQRVLKYFGDIPPGPPVAKFTKWIAKRTENTRQVMQDRVPQARLYKVWNVPSWGTREAAHLELLSAILASDKNSRLYERLVYRDQIASSVGSFLDDAEIAGQFYLLATAKPDVSLDKVEAAVTEELQRVLSQGVTQAELDRVRTQYFAGLVRGLQRIGGFGGKSDILAINQVYGGDPAYYKTYQKFLADATPSDIQAIAKAWLSSGEFALEVHPFPKLKESPSGVDRKQLPALAAAPEVKFPAIQRTTLSNGMKVVLAERNTVPLVEMVLMFDAGFASDAVSQKPGLASLAMNLMDEGTATRDALKLSEELANLGAELSTSSNLDYATVRLSALKPNLDASLALFADVVRNPAFPQKDLDRLKNQQLANIAQQKVSPQPMALRVMPRLMYGAGHAYANPLTGTGTEASVQALTQADMRAFYKTWIVPNNATLVVTGNITLAELKPKLEKLFAGWAKGTPPKKNLGAPSPVAQAIYVMDRPGAEQSLILAGYAAIAPDAKTDLANRLMNSMLGGDFTSRINLNLREDKHWSYGAGASLVGTTGNRPYLIFAPVQTDKTKESLAEIRKELQDVLGARPLTQPEFDRVQSNEQLALNGSWETLGGLQGALTELVQFNYPDDYYSTLSGKLKALKLAEAQAAAKRIVQPDKMIYIVVGDRAKVEPGLKELGLPVVALDADGQPIGQ